MIMWDHVTFKYLKNEDSVKIHIWYVRLNLHKNL